MSLRDARMDGLWLATRRSIRDAPKSNARLYRFLRATHHFFGDKLPPRSFADIDGRVHRNDLMLAGTVPDLVRHYRETGSEAVDAIERTLLRAGGPSPGDVESCLDFGCGYGRVLRVLAARFPRATIAACDLDPGAVAFCAAEFGAVPIGSRSDISAVPLGRYDVIWMGSVLTHLDEEEGRKILHAMADHLTTRGILVFSTHGCYASEDLASFPKLVAAARADVHKALKDRGVAYLPYAHYSGDGYGLSWHTPDYIRTAVQAIPGVSVILHEPAGWSGWQDLWGVARQSAD